MLKNIPLKKKVFIGAGIILAVFCLFFIYEIYIPRDLVDGKSIIYNAEKGTGGSEIASDLQKEGIIKNSWFFKAYAFLTGQYNSLQAGLYDLSPNMSVAGLVSKFAKGDIARQKLTIIEGWSAREVGKYLESKGFYTQKNFLVLTTSDLSGSFDFLKTKPKNVGLEGYLFPDTYSVPVGTSTEDLLKIMLKNFDTRLTPELRAEIAKQKKSIFQIVTMASILEKEVRSVEDKKVVAGILWKRIAAGMPLQVDATVNYATGKSDASVSLADSRVDSRYNTYKYYGLPIGPISNPGMDSILAAIYPTKSEYWFYLSAKGTGQTIFSKTFQEQTQAIKKYLN